jgi:hypothetical protein
MPLRRALIAVLFCVSTTRAADVTTLNMGVLAGDVVSISEKEIVLKNKDGIEAKVPMDEVLAIDYGTAGRPKNDAKYSDVELTDGSVLHCSSFLVKENNAVFKVLTTGQEVTTPLADIANVLLEGHVAKFRKDWDERITRVRKQDVYVDYNPKTESFRVVEGTFLKGNAAGTELNFNYLGAVRKVSLEKDPEKESNIYGIIFVRGVNAAAKPVACKLIDAENNLIYVSAVKTTAAGIEVETSCGVKLLYQPQTVARFDYRTSRLAYLGDLKPSNLVETSPFDTVEHYQVNRNLDGGQLKLGGKVYQSGIAVHAFTEIEFNIKGDYREFKALVGVDDDVSGHDGATPVKILGADRTGADWKELASFAVERKDRGKAPKVVSINIKDVQKLKIIVGTGDLQDIGKHVDFADAQVTK